MGGPHQPPGKAHPAATTATGWPPGLCPTSWTSDHQAGERGPDLLVSREGGGGRGGASCGVSAEPGSTWEGRPAWPGGENLVLRLPCGLPAVLWS